VKNALVKVVLLGAVQLIVVAPQASGIFISF